VRPWVFLPCSIAYVCGDRFLAYVDLLGTTYTAPAMATGFGAHLAVPLLRSFVERHPDGFDETAARTMLESCLEVLFYRDARSINKVRLRDDLPPPPNFFREFVEECTQG
jgi:20S proteasome alpha/beta subunit